MSLPEHISEAMSIQKELKSLSNQRSKLLKRYKEIEQFIAKVLQKEQLPGVRCGEKTILLNKKVGFAHKQKKSKDEAVINVIASHGISNPEKLLKDIENAKHGEAIVKQSIRIVDKKQASKLLEKNR